MTVKARDVGVPGIVVSDGCEQPCECWELNTGTLEEQAASASAPNS